MSTDYTRDEVSIVIDLIREKNPEYPLSPSQITFSTPSVFTPTQAIPRNTLLIATSIADRGYVGSQAFYYDRLQLAAFVNPNLPDQTTFVVEDEATMVDLLPAINARYNINLTADKIVDRPFPSFSNIDEAQVVLEVQNNSMCYLGTLTLTIGPNLIALPDVITVTDMDGLTYEAPPSVPLATAAPVTDLTGFDVEG